FPIDSSGFLIGKPVFKIGRHMNTACEKWTNFSRAVFLFERRTNRHDSRIRPLATLQLSDTRSEEHTSELQSRFDLVCRLLHDKKNQSSMQIYLNHIQSRT